jgi:hypothetical protein
LHVAQPEGLESVLRRLVAWPEGDELAKKWGQRDPTTIQRVDQLLAKSGLTMDAVMAETLSVCLDDVDRIEHHREALAEAVQASKVAEDAEFEDIPPPWAFTMCKIPGANLRSKTSPMRLSVVT